MFIRFTFCKFVPGHIREVRKIFNEEIVPAVRRQKGNLRIRLLEPTDKSNDFISISEWKTREDANAYESGGSYSKLIARLESFFIKPPELKTYSVEEAPVPADHL
jgi:heme-degrading monooxygenase HmoA